MKRKTTIITEEFDENGKLINKITETTEEEDGGYIYPQYPTWTTPSYTGIKPEWIYRPGDLTCDIPFSHGRKSDGTTIIFND